MNLVGAGPGEFDDYILKGDNVVGFIFDVEWIGNHLVKKHFSQSFFHVFFHKRLDFGNVFFGRDFFSVTVLHLFDHFVSFGADVSVVEVISNQTVENEFSGGSFAAEAVDVGVEGDEIGVGGGNGGAHRVAGRVPTRVTDQLRPLTLCSEGIE